jgi:hypothetical protein
MFLSSYLGLDGKTEECSNCKPKFTLGTLDLEPPDASQADRCHGCAILVYAAGRMIDGSWKRPLDKLSINAVDSVNGKTSVALEAEDGDRRTVKASLELFKPPQDPNDGLRSKIWDSVVGKLPKVDWLTGSIEGE